MGIPAQAFVEIDPNDLAAGQLFLFRDYWALRVSVAADLEGFLLLNGERAGEVHSLGRGTARTAAIAAPFGWYPMLSGSVKPAVAADPKCTLALTAEGPRLVGLDTRDKRDQTYLAIASNGQGVETHEVRRALHFTKWSVELCHKDQPLKSLGTLVEIDRRSTT